MGRSKKQLNIKNVKNIIKQESFRRGSPETKCKLLYKMANFLVKTNNLKYMNQGLDAYNQIYDLLSGTYGNSHPRTINVLLRIVNTEKKIDQRKYHLKREKNKNN
jgi:hypothetical protein